MIKQSAYNHVFNKWRGARARYFASFGNVGDRLIDLGTFQLFDYFDVTVVTEGHFDVIFWAGGGNMGNLYSDSRRRRTKAAELAAAHRKPIVVLPQSWSHPNDFECDIAYARERFSKAMRPDAILAHDLALAYRPDFKIPSEGGHEREMGCYFREDKERKVRVRQNLGDPIQMAVSPEEYILLASKSAHIHTDRLHFAVAALIAGRDVTLYDNSYHKNRGVWEYSLRSLGCGFSESLPATR